MTSNFAHIGKILFIGILTITLTQSIAQSDKIHQEAMFLQKVLEKNHYSPKNVDDSLSQEIFFNFLALLDPNHLYFTAEDIDKFSSYKFDLDDELKGQGWKFFPYMANVYNDRLLAAAGICDSISEKPFDFANEERLILTDNESYYAHDEKELKLRWHKWMKYQTLWQLVNISDVDEAPDNVENQLLEKETEIRNKIAKVEQRKIRRTLEHPQGFENQLKTLYFNAISACFDPHSNYLSNTDLQNFQSQLSTEGFSFGFDLDENEFGDVEIVRLIPGGPAWKSNELHKGDVLLRVKWLNKQEYDLTGADIMEVEHILQASNTELLEITVRNSSGTIKNIMLKKEKIRYDENIVKSFMINGEKKLGYISLPGFYTEWDNPNGHGCANDVAKEIVKLKKEQIDGLILDLRYNGGGSLEEGLNLAGIFIDEGPLLVIQGRDEKLNIVKDFNRGTVYDGPLLVMVNSQSASASELLASTLQDYNRAIIAGSPTFGKSTSQTIIPLDPNLVHVKEQKSPYGFVTVTGNKIFRITGKTAQLEGVQPDVYIPDINEIFDYREKNLPNALSKDSINKKIIFTKLPELPINVLKENSRTRLKQHEGFQKIDSLQKSPNFRSIRKLKEIPLNLSFFRNLNKDDELWNNLLHYVENAEINTFSVDNPVFNQALIDVDSYGKEINDSIINNLQSDIYIEESYFILTDFINNHKKP